DDADLIARLDAGEPPLSSDEAAARAPYERLFARTRDLDDNIEPPPGWKERALACWKRYRRRRARGRARGPRRRRRARGLGRHRRRTRGRSRSRATPAAYSRPSSEPRSAITAGVPVVDSVRACARARPVSVSRSPPRHARIASGGF